MPLTPEDIVKKPTDPSDIRWFYRLGNSLGREDIINLGIGQAGHEAPEELMGKIKNFTTTHKYPSGVTSKETADVIAQKMLLTHFMDKDGNIFGKEGSVPGLVVPDFYMMEKEPGVLQKGATISNNGASGLIHTTFDYASSRKAINNFIFAVPYFGPYDTHLDLVIDNKRAILNQMPSDKDVQEAISSYLSNDSLDNSIKEVLADKAFLSAFKTILSDKTLIEKRIPKINPIDLVSSNFRWDEKAINSLDQNLNNAEGRSVLLLCTPNNPNGVSIDIEEFKSIVRVVTKLPRDKMPFIVLDEPYDLLTFKPSAENDYHKMGKDDVVKSEWRQHVSITHALNEMVISGELSGEHATAILNSTLFINSSSKGPAAAALGGGYMFSTNLDLISDIQKITTQKDGPLRQFAIYSIEAGKQGYLNDPNIIKEIAKEYGDKALSFEHWMNRTYHEKDFKNPEGSKKAVLRSPDGGMYVYLDAAAFLGKSIPETENGNLLRDYKKLIKGSEKFENATDVALYMLLEKSLICVGEDGFGVHRVYAKDQPSRALRASVGEASMGQLRDSAKRFGEAIDIVQKYNKQLDNSRARS